MRSRQSCRPGDRQRVRWREQAAAEAEGRGENPRAQNAPSIFKVAASGGIFTAVRLHISESRACCQWSEEDSLGLSVEESGVGGQDGGGGGEMTGWQAPAESRVLCLTPSCPCEPLCVPSN